jgi:uracil-DNA glycosylase family 4
MSPSKKSPWHSTLELYRKLGIRYVSMERTASIQADPVIKEVVAETAPDEPVREVSAAPVSTVEMAPPPASVKTKWLTAQADTIEAMELTAFDQDICGCQKCSLGATRKNFVFGSGNPQAKIMFIGEAPGADEDEQGLPFVGRAGQLLTKIIESTQIWKRPDVFICNVLKCRPPGNRTPQPEEVEQCRPYLEEQIQIIKPKLIIALGASAAQAVLKTTESVGKLRNQWHDYNGIPLRVTYHPAALLRFEGYKKDVWQDMKEATAKFKELEGLT